MIKIGNGGVGGRGAIVHEGLGVSGGICILHRQILEFDLCLDDVLLAIKS